MQDLKSHTQFFLGLYDSLLRGDMVRQYDQPSHFGADYNTLVARVKSEGFSFLTKTLPVLGKAIDTALQDGTTVVMSAFKQSRHGKYPAFLQVLFSRVFNRDGTLKDVPCISAISDLRQICYLTYKYEVPYDAKCIEGFLENFVEVDQEIGQKPALLERYRPVLEVARTLLSRVVSDTTSLIFDDIVPKHGPGAVATGEKNWEKMNFTRKYDCIHQVYPYYKFFYANAMDLAASVKHYKSLTDIPSGISKVCLVPKDSRGPRLICMEPLEFQWVQQGLARKLVGVIERHPLTRGHVNFSNQEVNRGLALAGSCKGTMISTLDMKEASDRVSYWLVDALFQGTTLLPKLMGTRTEATELPNGRILLMQKFAPMGSALCFPIEALVHWALAVAALNVEGGIALKRALQAVYVYGDDIIIKGQNHMPLLDTFPAFGLRFNAGKCCTAGIFRESCGMDAVLGEAVTPLKVKRLIPSRTYDANSFISYIAYSNTLWNRCYYSSSNYIKDWLEKLFGHIPNVPEGSDIPGFYTRVLPPNETQSKKRYNQNLQRYEIRARKIGTHKITRPNDRSEYHRKLVIRSDEFVAGVYTTPHRIKIKQGWSASYNGNTGKTGCHGARQ